MTCAVCGKPVLRKENNDIIGARVSFGDYEGHENHNAAYDILCHECHLWLYDINVVAHEEWVKRAPLFPFECPIPFISTNW